AARNYQRQCDINFCVVHNVSFPSRLIFPMVNCPMLVLGRRRVPLRLLLLGVHYGEFDIRATGSSARKLAFLHHFLCWCGAGSETPKPNANGPIMRRLPVRCYSDRPGGCSLITVFCFVCLTRAARGTRWGIG